MPDLSALHHVHNVVMVAPEICIFIFEPAIEYGEERIPARQFPATSKIGYNMVIKIVQCLQVSVRRNWTKTADIRLSKS